MPSDAPPRKAAPQAPSPSHPPPSRPVPKPRGVTSSSAPKRPPPLLQPEADDAEGDWKMEYDQSSGQNYYYNTVVRLRLPIIPLRATSVCGSTVWCFYVLDCLLFWFRCGCSCEFYCTIVFVCCNRFFVGANLHVYCTILSQTNETTWEKPPGVVFNQAYTNAGSPSYSM